MIVIREFLCEVQDLFGWSCALLDMLCMTRAKCVLLGVLSTEEMVQLECLLLEMFSICDL